jgi:transposase InsO family protein
MCGIQHIRTTPYHPAANGLVERLHRTLKAAIMFHKNMPWTDALPIILLGIRTAYKEDLNHPPQNCYMAKHLESLAR